MARQKGGCVFGSLEERRLAASTAPCPAGWFFTVCPFEGSEALLGASAIPSKLVPRSLAVLGFTLAGLGPGRFSAHISKPKKPLMTQE